MIKELNKIFNITKGKIELIILLILRCPFDAVWNLARALFLHYAFNSILTRSITTLNKTCILFALSGLILFFYNGTVWVIFSAFNIRIERILRFKLFNKIITLSMKCIESKSRGEWATRLNTDVQLPTNKVINIPHALVASVNILVSSCILFFMNKRIFVLVMAFTLPLVIISRVLSSKFIPKHKTKSLKALSENSTDLTTIIECMEIAAIYDAKEYLLQRFEVSSKKIRNSNMKMHSISALNKSIVTVFGMLGFLVLLLVSATWINSGNLTFGDLTAAFQFRGGILMGSMMLANCIINIKACTPSLKRVNEVFLYESEG